mmetsp:Transcript_130546/g.363791  ORF Transcript_130546/g.363791 Transcript_130546/m.363791 type:complete len:219 (+) Transcript_130546:632-1288(+)
MLALAPGRDQAGVRLGRADGAHFGGRRRAPLRELEDDPGGVRVRADARVGGLAAAVDGAGRQARLLQALQQRLGDRLRLGHRGVPPAQARHGAHRAPHLGRGRREVRPEVHGQDLLRDVRGRLPHGLHRQPQLPRADPEILASGWEPHAQPGREGHAAALPARLQANHVSQEERLPGRERRLLDEHEAGRNPSRVAEHGGQDTGSCLPRVPPRAGRRA